LREDGDFEFPSTNKIPAPWYCPAKWRTCVIPLARRTGGLESFRGQPLAFFTNLLFNTGHHNRLIYLPHRTVGGHDMQRGFGLEVPQTLDELCDPTRMALLVYDMQVGVVSQIAESKQIIARVSLRVTCLSLMKLPALPSCARGWRGKGLRTSQK
jgi:hypothetical protein